MSNKFKFPKFTKGQYVTTPDGTGNIKAIKWDAAKNWYLVNGKWYAEVEVF